MKKSDFQMLVAIYGERKAKKAKRWFQKFNKSFRDAVYPVKFCEVNEYLWNG